MALVLVAACGGRDVTSLNELSSFGEPARERVFDGAAPAIDSELTRLVDENQVEIERIQAESSALYARMTERELAAALAGAPAPSLEAIRSERAMLSAATLSPAEQATILDLLGVGDDPESSVSFHGRLVMRGDVIHFADDLLAASDNGPLLSPLVAKANVGLTIVPNAEDSSGTPIPGGPARPDLIAKVEDDQVLFWRPDLGRRYYIVLDPGVPDSIFHAFVMASYAVESALPDDCLSRTFTVMRASTYAPLHPLVQALGSVIDVEHSTTACLNRADGCANFPRLENLAIAPGTNRSRMRLGTYIGLETDFDSRDPGEEPDLTSVTARNVVLHELSHVLGFDHPRYSELDPESDTNVARVPQSSQGTVPSFMFTTSHPRFSPTVSDEDKRVLSRVYSGGCTYRPEYRVLGDVCSPESESACSSHGGSCEVSHTAEGAQIERCRWHDFTDESACSRYSAGAWETSNEVISSTVFPGEAGACITACAELSACVPESFISAATPFDGRCCTKFGQDEPGLFFEAFSDGESSSYFCSDQKGLGDPVGGSWEFTDAAEQAFFTPLDAATGTSAPGWVMGSGDYTQEQALSGHMTMGNRRLRSGCVMTEVTTADAGESGIVFNYRTTGNYYVFDVIPNVRRRIRQVVDGVSTDLSLTPWAGPATWTSIGLAVCFGDGIHTFIDGQPSSRVSVEDHRVDFVGTGGRVGLWNDTNQGARHAYLRSYSLVEGYALLE